MRLTVLAENNTLIDQYLSGGPELSFFIEHDSLKILFDTGYSDNFIKNARKLRIPIEQTDTIVLSHAHNDHTGGLPYLFNEYAEMEAFGHSCRRPTLIAHPLIFNSRIDGKCGEIGSMLDGRKVTSMCDVQLSKGPVWISESLVFLGEIPRINDFENFSPIGEMVLDCQKVPDCLYDDSALVYKAKDGLVIMTGCSHSGICNIVAHAIKVCGDTRVRDIIGGFHLLKASSSRIEGTTKFLKSVGITRMHPCHCTDLSAKCQLSRHFDICEVGVGLVMSFD